MERTTCMRRLLWSGALLAVLTAHPAEAGAPQQDSEEVERTVRTRIEFGRERNEIGIAVRDLELEEAATEAAARAGGAGAVVTDVRAEGPGAAAGIEPGDVIVEFDGERVRGALQLARLVRETPAGRAAPVRVLRNGSPVALSVTPAEAPGWTARLPQMDALRRRLDDFQDRVSETEELTVERDDSGRRRFSAFQRWPEAFRDVIASSPGRVRLGVRADSVGGQLAEYFGTTAGVLVEHVDDGAAGADAGLRAGDVITAIDGQAVDDLAELRRQLARLEPDAGFDITVVRDRAVTSLTAEPAREDQEEDPRPRRRGSAI